MSHLDEGTLHALLDGELDAKEVREIQAHLGSCSACGTRLQSVKEIAAESDRLVSVIEFPGTPRRPAGLDAAATRDPIAEEPAAAPEFPSEPAFEPAPGYEEEQRAPAPSRPLERRIGAEPVYHEAPPMILVPDEYAWGERRRRMVAYGRWAAFIVVAVGAGYIASEVRKSGAPVAVEQSAPLSDDAAPVVSSAEETSRRDSAQGFGTQSPPATARDQAPPPAATRQRAPTPPAAKPAPATESAKTARKSAPAEADRPNTLTNAAVGDAGADAPADEQNDSDPAAESESAPLNVREEAAEAMADLDRERRLERAAAATAALDADSRRPAPVTRNAAASPAAPAPAASAPVPRTLEQRSNIYLRIGLDEAARQLGRPVHVIEGMQQQFMGLAQGVASPAADATRPVVRVVYQDNQGRMILLDQQRIRPGQAWNTTDTRWVVGEIGLSLLGEPAPEILRNLRPRVR